MVEIAKVGSSMILSGPGTGTPGRRKNAAVVPDNATKIARERDREAQLIKLLSGQRLPERPFERLPAAVQPGIAEQAAHFLSWREIRAELNFG